MKPRSLPRGAASHARCAMPPSPLRALTAASLMSLALGLWSTGCGGSGGGESTTPTEHVSRYVDAPGLGAREYSTATDDAAPESADAAAIATAALEIAAQSDRPLVLDARLSTLAAWVGADIAEQGDAPPAEVVQFLARHLGLVEPVPAVAYVVYTDAETVMQSLAEQVTALLEMDEFTHVGVATLPSAGAAGETGEGATPQHMAILVMTQRGVELTPVARERDAGSLLLSGNLVGNLRNPEVVLLHPDGHSTRAPAGAGPSFQVRLLMPASGVYSVELLARGAAGITVVANFPVYVNGTAPSRLGLAADDPTEATTADGVRDALIQRIADERSRAGSPPLTVHDGLSAVAEAHCRDMADNDFVGHDSPNTGTPAMRITSAGFASGLMLENVGRGYSAGELHRGLMDSPGHRANILDSRVTHLGISVVAIPDGSRTAYLVTEIFTQMTAAIDVSGAPEQLLTAINEGRRARRASAVVSDELLARAAQEAAEAYFADPEMSEQDATDQASAALRRFAIAYRRVGALMTVVSRVEDAGRLEPTFDPDVTTLGIGVAQGNRPDLAPNSIAVVIVLGWPR